MNAGNQNLPRITTAKIFGSNRNSLPGKQLLLTGPNSLVLESFHAARVLEIRREKERCWLFGKALQKMARISEISEHHRTARGGVSLFSLRPSPGLCERSPGARDPLILVGANPTCKGTLARKEWRNPGRVAETRETRKKKRVGELARAACQ